LGVCLRDIRALLEVSFARVPRLKLIGVESFSSCESLRSICIPVSVEILSNSCFYRCTSLSSLTFELRSHLIQIDDMAVGRCTHLLSACFPSSLRSIGFVSRTAGAYHPSHSTRDRTFGILKSEHVPLDAFHLEVFRHHRRCFRKGLCFVSPSSQL
jgi:hypothetical protein